MNLMQDRELSPAQVLQLTRAMLAVAHVDGIHPAEAALIGQFYEASRSADMPATAAVVAGGGAGIEPALWAAGGTELADTVLLMCLMTGYADGKLSAAELALVQQTAKSLGVAPARVEALQAQVRDQLVGALSHLPDAGSVAAVVRELDAGPA